MYSDQFLYIIFIPRLVQRRNAIGHNQFLRRAASDESLNTLASYQVRINRSRVYDSRRNSIASVGSCMTLAQSELDHLENVYKSAISKSKRSLFKSKFSRSLSKRRRSFSIHSSFTSQASNNSLQSQSAITLDPRQLTGQFQKVSPKKNDFAMLEQKLANASGTSAETILTEAKNLNKVSINVLGKF